MVDSALEAGRDADPLLQAPLHVVVEEGSRGAAGLGLGIGDCEVGVLDHLLERHAWRPVDHAHARREGEFEAVGLYRLADQLAQDLELRRAGLEGVAEDERELVAAGAGDERH